MKSRWIDTLIDAGIDDLPILDIDPVDLNGPYIRNTLKLDKNENREQALFDIYRVMRPGEPPTIDTAEVLFNGLFSMASATICPRSAA